MKLSVHESILGAISLADKMTWLQHNGFDGIDIVGDAGPAKVRELNRLCAAGRVEVATIYSRLGQEGLLGETAKQRAAAVDLLKQRFDLAVSVGAKNVIIVPVFGEPRLPVPPENVRGAEMGVLTAVLGEVAPFAGEAGVKLIVEPLNQKETHLITDPEVGVQVCKAVGHPSLQTMVDTYHMDLEGQDMAAQMRVAAPYVGLVHLSDRNRSLPGEGGIDFAPFLAAAQEKQYSGYFGFEGRPAGSLEQLAEAGRKMRQLWQKGT